MRGPQLGLHSRGSHDRAEALTDTSSVPSTAGTVYTPSRRIRRRARRTASSLSAPSAAQVDRGGPSGPGDGGLSSTMGRSL